MLEDTGKDQVYVAIIDKSCRNFIEMLLPDILILNVNPRPKSHEQFSMTTFSMVNFPMATFSMTTFSMMTFSMTTFFMATFSMTTISMATFFMTTFSMMTFSMATFFMTTFSMMTFSMATFSLTIFSMAIFYLLVQMRPYENFFYDKYTCSKASMPAFEQVYLS